MGLRGRISAALGGTAGQAPAGQRDAARLTEAALRAMRDSWYPPPIPLRDLPAVRSLLEADEAVRIAAIVAIIDDATDGMHLGSDNARETLLGWILAGRPTVQATELETILLRIEHGLRGGHMWSVLEMVPAIARLTRDRFDACDPGTQERLRVGIAAILALARQDSRFSPSPSVLKMLQAFVPVPVLDLAAISVEHPVGQGMRNTVAASTESPDVLGPFVAHLATPISKARPNDAWLERTRTLAGALTDATGLLHAILQAALDAPDSVTSQTYGSQTYEHTAFSAPGEDAFLKAVIWAAGALADAEAIPLLRALAIKCVTFIGGDYGKPRSMTIAQACPHAIALVGAPGSLPALQQLQRSTRHGSLLREIAKAIDALAAAGAMTPGELLETAIDGHGLDASGSRVMPVGPASATVTLAPSGDVEVRWVSAAGKSVTSLPKRERDEHAADTAVVASVAKALKATIAAERIRLDGLFVEARRWTPETWRGRYLDHPVVGVLARGLIWRFDLPDGPRAGTPLDSGTALDASGTPFSIAAATGAELWHPVTASTDEVLAWRTRLLAEGRRQPIKQAFRETYVVTPAELATGTYSNRFASHIFRQVQARALMKGRGWKPVALAWWDDGIDHGVTRRTYPAHSIRAEFFYDPIEEENPSGDLYRYCTTDQVAFFEGATDRRVAVHEVAPILFSEVMRDVDLFVGVTSIGADPEWLDHGERRFDRYWYDWGFGELEAAARVRKEVVGALLPGLVIADRCRLEDRWLEVRGDLASYRIHLGSGNILMRPSDRYLCIVAKRTPTSDARVHLPFDDDPVLSMVLSKAFLLANDRAITDETILAQIRG